MKICPQCEAQFDEELKFCPNDGAKLTEDQPIEQTLAVEGKMHSQGKVFFANGDSYEGELVANQYHGQGKHIWANGSRYVGEFKHGKFHGKGKEYNSNGQLVAEGEWRNGEFMGKQASSEENIVESLLMLPFRILGAD